MQAISVFLIDDSEADAALIQLVAKQSKLASTIRHFDGGQVALDHLQDPANPIPDLVLLDLNMPGMSGHEVLAAVRADERLSALPIVVLTSSEDETDVRRSYSGHANAYVVKPVGIDGFKQILDAIRDFWFTIVTLPPH